MEAPTVGGQVKSRDRTDACRRNRPFQSVGMSAVHPATHVAKTSSWYNTLGPSDESRTGPKAFALPALEPPKEDSGDDLKLKGKC